MEFPESIGKLENLERLEVIYNKLSTLPKSLLNLKSLTRLAIINCNLEDNAHIIQTIKERNVHVLDIENESKCANYNLYTFK